MRLTASLARGTRCDIPFLHFSAGMTHHPFLRSNSWGWAKAISPFRCATTNWNFKASRVPSAIFASSSFVQNIFISFSLRTRSRWFSFAGALISTQGLAFKIPLLTAKENICFIIRKVLFAEMGAPRSTISSIRRITSRLLISFAFFLFQRGITSFASILVKRHEKPMPLF